MDSNITEEQVYETLLTQTGEWGDFNNISALGISLKLTNSKDNNFEIPSDNIVEDHCKNLEKKGLIVVDVIRKHFPYYRALTPHEIAQRKLGK